MASNPLRISLILAILLLFCGSFLIQAQQPYIRKATTLCNGAVDNSTSALGYNCNGVSSACRAFLTFRSMPPFDTVSSISRLLSADPSQLALLNSVSEIAVLDANKLVLVPVSCSCSGQFYQSNTTYAIEQGDFYFSIANNTFQGLSTCQSLQAENPNAATNLLPGTRITVPLRCACPTKNQTENGIRYLLSYLVTQGDYVSLISQKFGVDTDATLAANSLSEQDFTIFPFTTLLVPLQNPPSSNQTTATPPPPPSPQSIPLDPSPDKSSNKTWVYVVVGVVGALFLTLSAGATVYYMFFRKRIEKNDPIIESDNFGASDKPTKEKGDEESGDFLDSISSIAQSLKVYAFEELQSATENFSPKSLIRGSVYRGIINGDFAAIKKTNGDVTKEINLLKTINHFNVIRLSGVGFSEGNWYLVYEYANNGPLSDWIYLGNDKKNVLSWIQRIQIALDVATGLNYLHSYTYPPYVHKDLSSGNVLLDSDFRAKISNFNLARLADGEEGLFAVTRHIVGTKGYMAPEYLEHGLVSPKVDVYAFGVLVLEMLAGKEVAALSGGDEGHLYEVLSSVLHEEDSHRNLIDFMDPSLLGNYPPDLAIFVIRLIDNCVKKDPFNRMGMDEIVQSLSKTLNTSLLEIV